jgi:hypothetical protein
MSKAGRIKGGIGHLNFRYLKVHRIVGNIAFRQCLKNRKKSPGLSFPFIGAYNQEKMAISSPVGKSVKVARV